MSDLSLLREKFTIRELGVDSGTVIALGNRLTLSLGRKIPPLIIRGHSMHMTLRYGAEILRHLSYISHVENVETFFQWEEAWQKLIEKFEGKHAPDTWICAYHKGKPVYQSGYHHMFFDIIEQCEHQNLQSADNYEQSLIMAQKAFKQMGKNVMIEQESHVGYVLDDNDNEMRFAIIIRMPEHKATFIVRMFPNKELKTEPQPYEAMQLGANYIEGLNHAVRSGFMEADMNKGNISPMSDTGKLYKILQARIQQIGVGISQSERKFDVKYRPEKPDFKYIQRQCKESAL
jgi:hypothetical protein